MPAVEHPVQPSTPPSRQALYWLLSLGLAALFLYFALRGIAWHQVWAILRQAALPWAALALLLNTAALFARSLRWRALLQAQRPVSVADSFWATAAGYLGNNVLPARAGEMIRTLLISRRTGANTAFVLTTALSERVVDAAVLVTITASVLLLLPAKPAWLDQTVRPFALLGFGSVAAVALLPLLKDHGLRLLGRLPLPGPLRDKVAALVEQAFAGIQAFHDRGRLLRFLALTAAIWFLDGAIAVAVAQSIDVALSFPLAFLLIACLGLGSALPSTPGFLGIYQFVAVTVLTPFGLTQTQAIAHILLFQALNYVVVIVWGSIGMLRLRSGAATTSPPSPAG